MSRKSYKEVKNYIHNELGLTKEEVRNIIKETVKEQLPLMVQATYGMSFQDWLQYNLRCAVREQLEHQAQNSISNSIRDFISKVVKEELKIEVRVSDNNGIIML